MDSNKWAKAIAGVLSNGWDGKEFYPEDAEILRQVLEKALISAPEDCMRLVGTRVIEETFFDFMN